MSKNNEIMSSDKNEYDILYNKLNENYLQLVENVINKNYLYSLSDCDVEKLSENNNIKNVKLYRITEMVYEKDEFSLYKLATVLNSVTYSECSVIVILDSNGSKTDFYIGIRNKNENKTTAGIAAALINSLQGQFPGSKVEPVKKDAEIFTKLNDTGNNSVISAVSSIANIKDKEIRENKSFIQGLEKLALSAQNKEYTAIILADSVSGSEIAELRKAYEEIYTAISPFANMQLGESVNVSESKSNVKLFSILKSLQNKDFKDIKHQLFDEHNPNYQVGTSKSVNLNIQNKQIADLLQRIEKELKRLDEAECLGAWNCATYFISKMPSVAEKVAANYRAIISGENTGVEASAINTWRNNENKRNEKFNRISKYLSFLIHPKFIINGSATKENRILTDATIFVSSNELAIHMGLPRHSVCGFPVIEHSDFAKEVVKYNDTSVGDEFAIGRIFNMGTETTTPVKLSRESFSMHAFITGATGSGKSNTIYKLIEQLGTKFMVIEPAKGEYKNVFGHRDDVTVYSTNPSLGKLLKINPFSFPREIHIFEHIDRLIEIFNACWPMYAAMPAVLKDAVISAYEKCGWDLINSTNSFSDNLYPTFEDVTACIYENINSSAYSTDTKGDYIGSLATRLSSLTNGINGLIFSSNETSNNDLFDENIIIDLSRVGSLETKSLIMGIIVMKLNEYRMAETQGMNMPLRHITVIEEAHNILRKTGTEQGQESANLAGKSVEMISNSIAEMRTYGEGFIISDQSPTAVDSSAIKNTNTKIIMRLPEENDRTISGKSAALKEEQFDEISKLPKGVAVIYQNDWVEPVLCKIDKFECDEKLYRFNPEQNIDNVDMKKLNTELVKFLLSRGHRIDFDIDYIKEALIKSKFSSTNKIAIQSIINEYNMTNSLSIWSRDKFDKLADIITKIILGKKKINHIISSCSNLDMLNNKFQNIVDENLQNENLTEYVILDIFQCFMKKYSTENNDNKLYAYWKENICKKGELLK